MGKSTLLKLLTGDLKPSNGELKRNHRLRLGEYSQHAADQVREEGREGEDWVNTGSTLPYGEGENVVNTGRMGRVRMG